MIVVANRHKLSFGLGAIALLLLLLATGFGVYQFTHRPSRIPFQEVEINRVTTSGDLGKVTLSPDGKYLAYLRREEDGRTGLWIRNLASNSNVQVLPLTNPRTTTSPSARITTISTYESSWTRCKA